VPWHPLVAYVESAARGIKLHVAWFSNYIEVFVILLCTNIYGLMSSSIVAMMPTEESKVDQGQAISIIDTYSLCPEISVVLAFKLSLCCFSIQILCYFRRLKQPFSRPRAVRKAYSTGYAQRVLF